MPVSGSQQLPACELLGMWIVIIILTVTFLCNVTTAGFVHGLLLSHFLGSFARPLYPLPSKLNKDKQPLQTFRPYNIAHRGSNGEFPEETAGAYMVCDMWLFVMYFIQYLESTAWRVLQNKTHYQIKSAKSLKKLICVCDLMTWAWQESSHYLVL